MDVSSVLRKNWKRMNRNEMTRLGLLHASPNPCKQMERVKGIEPSSRFRQADKPNIRQY